MLNQVACHLKYAIFVIIGILVVIMLSKWTGKKDLVTPATPTTLLQQPQQQRQVMGDVMSQAAASNRDSYTEGQNPVVSLIDVTTALASLNTTIAFYGDVEVAEVAGAPIHTLKAEMLTRQQVLMQQLTSPHTTPPAPTQLMHTELAPLPAAPI